MMRALAMFLALISGAFLLDSCAGAESDIAGTGSQTGNTIVSGTVLDAHSKPISGALVRIRPLTWTDSIVTRSNGAWSCIKDTVTDSLGQYRFDEVYSGSYRIETRKEDLASIQGIKVGNVPVLAPRTSLAKTATITGEVHINDSTRSGRIEIYGVARFIALPDTGHEVHYRLDSLPPGNHTLRIWSPRLGRSVLEIPVTLVPGGTTALNDEDWSREPDGPEEVD